jgi:hypothetical protein
VTIHAICILLKYDFSGFAWQIPAPAADTATAIEALSRWFTSFGVVPY